MTHADICFICQRRDSGVAVGTTKKIQWFCESCGIETAKRASLMSAKVFEHLELRAVDDAGAKAGEYLDRIGKVSLETLSEAEWKEFCRTMIYGFGEALRDKIKNDEAPF